MKAENRKTILIVDDEIINLKTISEILEKKNPDYNLLIAPGGGIALKILQKKLPDLIITDWNMPQTDGIEFIKQLKQNDRTKDIPVIMCTGVMTSSEHLQTALAAGAVDYIRKPVDEVELTARVNANLHLVEKYNEIKRLNEAKNKIFSVISHDLRNPVGSMKTFTELILTNLREYSLDELEEFIRMLSKRSSSVYTILENLLSWARSQQKNIEFKPQKQSLFDTALAGINLLEANAADKNITLQNTIPKDIEAFFDSDLISTVIRNLINNAVKFTPKGGRINLSAETGEDVCTIAVSDTGVGIPPERLKKLFDKTTHETTRGTDAETGSGLGLKLCGEFVEMNRGEIWAESTPNKGSTFYFTLPSVKSE